MVVVWQSNMEESTKPCLLHCAALWGGATHQLGDEQLPVQRRGVFGCLRVRKLEQLQEAGALYQQLRHDDRTVVGKSACHRAVLLPLEPNL